MQKQVVVAPTPDLGNSSPVKTYVAYCPEKQPKCFRLTAVAMEHLVVSMEQLKKQQPGTYLPFSMPVSLTQDLPKPFSELMMSFCPIRTEPQCSDCLESCEEDASLSQPSLEPSTCLPQGTEQVSDSNCFASPTPSLCNLHITVTSTSGVQPISFWMLRALYACRSEAGLLSGINI